MDSDTLGMPFGRYFTPLRQEIDDESSFGELGSCALAASTNNQQNGIGMQGIARMHATNLCEVLAVGIALSTSQLRQAMKVVIHITNRWR